LLESQWHSGCEKHRLGVLQVKQLPGPWIVCLLPIDQLFRPKASMPRPKVAIVRLLAIGYKHEFDA